MSNFQLSHRKKNSTVVLDISGKIIYGQGSAEMHKVFRSLVEQKTKNILLNFAEVTAIDSSGFGELVGGYVAVKRIDGTIKIFNLSKNVENLFKLTRLSSVFDIYGSEEEAVKSCRKAVKKVNAVEKK